MYIREIEGRTEFSSCKTIKLIYDHADMGLVAGQYACNPSSALIAAEGWRPYIPPAPEPQPQDAPTMDERLTALNTLLKGQVYALDDEAALEVIALFPAWAEQIGKPVEVGFRTYFDDKLWKCVQAHTVSSEWRPDLTPALWARVTVEEWPEWVRPSGAQDAYNSGDKVTYNGQHYISLIDANVYSPEEYPAGWQMAN